MDAERSHLSRDNKYTRAIEIAGARRVCKRLVLLLSSDSPLLKPSRLTKGTLNTINGGPNHVIPGLFILSTCESSLLSYCGNTSGGIEFMRAYVQRESWSAFYDFVTDSSKTILASRPNLSKF